MLESVAGGGYASDLLRDAAKPLSTRDAGLASQIVFGCLRFQNQLDYLIERHSGRQATSLHMPVLLALRTAIFQLRYLERIPPHAAVDEAVEFVKQNQRAASGLTNAVLRKVNRNPMEWPTPSLALACPEWMLKRWTEEFGEATAHGIAGAFLHEPEPFIRIAPGELLPPDIEVEPTSIEGCYKLLSPVTESLRLHDISSQAIVPMLGLEPQHAYLDLCSAPGNKTAQALETKPAFAVTCDISHRRLKTVVHPSMKVVLDATEELPFNRKFDRILIDAPCSGTGTLGRNPEIKWRLQPSDLARQQARQIDIVKQAARVLAPDGKILYATCSLEREENQAVIEQVVSASNLLCERTLFCERTMVRCPGRDAGDGFFAALLANR